MRVRAYVLTFIAYIAMHSLRTAYSFSKSYFKPEYNFSNAFLAVLDSSIYFAMGLGFFMRYFFMKKDIITSFFITGLVYIVAYTLFPLLSLAGVLDEFNAGWISLILMILFGYFQMNCWPVSFLLVSEYFTNEENGGLIGFWTTSSSIGNVLGYMLPAFFILTLHDPWQVPNLILVAILLLTTVAVYFFVERSNKAKQQGYLGVQNGQQEDGNFSMLLDTFVELFSTLQTGLLVVIACVYKAITYTFLLWLPILIDSFGQKADSAIISIIFNLSGILGAYLLGKLYETSQSGDCYGFLQILNPCMGILTIVGIVMLSKIQEYSFILYAIIIFMEGFLISGNLNILNSNQLIKVSGNTSLKLDLYTTAQFALSAFSVGVAQLMIGLFMASSSEGGESFSAVFMVLIIMAGLAFIMVVVRSYRIYQRISKQVNSV